MALTIRPGALTIVNDPAPAFAPRIENLTEHDVAIAQHMDRIDSWIGAWQKDLKTTPYSQMAYINGRDEAVSGTLSSVQKSIIAANRPSWAFPDATNGNINLPTLSIPASYTVYVAFRINIADTIGLFGHSNATGARVLIRADATGAIRADHGSAAEDILSVPSRWPLGERSIMWASFNAVTRLMSIGGMVGGVVDLAPAATTTLPNLHKGGNGAWIGNVGGFFGIHTIAEVIVASGDLLTLDPAAHEGILRPLAAKYTRTVA